MLWNKSIRLDLSDCLIRMFCFLKANLELWIILHMYKTMMQRLIFLLDFKNKMYCMYCMLGLSELFGKTISKINEM